jgi:CubicO group peptidase (beta-lactamase class C family)
MREQVFQPLGMDDTGAESTTEENPEGIGEPGEDAPFITWIRDLILEPLGIISVKAMPATAPERATFYVPGFGPNPVLRHGLHVMRAQNLSCYAGAMAFFSTPSDLVRFGLAMNNATLLQPATVERLQTSQQLASGQEAGTMVSWISFRERGSVVAVMSNISSADTSSLASKVAEAFTK